jgi:ferredoxin
MAILITDSCINCGACEPECPNNAIYEGGVGWRWSDGTSLKLGSVDGVEVSAEQKPLSNEFYYIASSKCTECVGFYDEPQCASVCPVGCCVIDTSKLESKETLLTRKNFLHDD